MQITIKSNLEDLIPRYLENRQAELEQMADLLGAADFDAIRGVAHNMKGIGIPYGFKYVSDLGLELETAAKAHDADQLRLLLGQYKTYLDELEIVYQ